ncbi:MAG: GNAT family N-acetyltransferase [Burkholderiales bacterium]|jgi:ribosomal protein S18 acetylase RimI-like enzyme|nr:GNAT family N-acetyltransferase [Burkholderiales bacterium]
MNHPQTFPTISFAQKEDIHIIHRLAEEIWYLHYPGIITVKQIDYMLEQRYAPQEINRCLASPACTWFKVVVEKKILGFGHFEESPSMRSVKVDKFYMHPKIQRRGCGATLMRFAEAHYGKLGFVRVWLQVNKGNENSIKFYQKVGYQTEKEVIIDIGQGFVMDDLIMSKMIS